MHDLEIVAIWFTLIITGMILTILMPWIFSESRGTQVNQDECERIPARQGLHERAKSIVQFAKEA